jgi:hypothetical protein
VAQVAAIEMQLGICEVDWFTPNTEEHPLAA